MVIVIANGKMTVVSDIFEPQEKFTVERCSSLPDHGVHLLLSLSLRAQLRQALRQRISFEGHSGLASAQEVM